ncbi:unnamed protein product [Caenorhabditis auriculariae]|uniref:Serpentine receptor class gamma n=1 Tax=Caenorhabditis auriculariae TaxID=2777116 RepID=A0A8S1HU37_9PELO|nr:unnamed protein product [Caenorhabditis auriculariae]
MWFQFVPISHLVFMPIGWFSFLVYLLCGLIISVNLKDFKSSYFKLVLLHTDALQDLILSSTCCLLCILMYFAVFLRVFQQKNLQSTNNPDHVILWCAFLTFLPFLPNTIKSFILYFATDAETLGLATDLWYFATELMCIAAPWTLILTCKGIRDILTNLA